MIPAPRLLWLASLGLLVAALPLLAGPLSWVAVAAMWGGLGAGTLLDLWALRRGRPELSARVPHSVGVGDAAVVPVAVTLGGRFALGATLRSEVTEPLRPGDGVEVRLEAGKSLARLELPAPRRGTGSLRALWLRLSGPLGLWQRIQRFSVEGGRVAVVPNARRVRQLALAHLGARPLSGGLAVQRRAGEGGEFDAMVAYVRGMDVRKIDWKSSARHMDLRVRRFRIEQNQRMILCVDTGRTMADEVDGVERLDHAIHAAMALGRTALKAGDQVGLYAYAAEPTAWVAPAGGVRQNARIAEACAALAAEPVETNHVLGLHALSSKLKRRSLVVILTELTDSTTAELMVEHVGHLVRRHLVLFMALDDPVVEEPFSRGPATAEDLAAAVVAGGLRSDRHRVLRRLSRMGVDVLHGPPGPATLHLLARYLLIKRRGLIG